MEMLMVLLLLAATATAYAAPHCDTACGEGGECVNSWTTNYCRCSPGFGPGNNYSCCARNCSAAGTCGAPEGHGYGRCDCFGGYSGESCSVKPEPEPDQPSSECDSAMALACNPARAQGFTGCVMCAGQHQGDLLKANCTNGAIQDFCQNKTCATELADKCGSVSSCAQCSFCAQQQKLCRGDTKQIDVFCEAGCKATRTCELQLEDSCGADRRQGGRWQCLTCAGVHASTIATANCTNSLIDSYCTDKGCIPQLADKCRASATNGSCFDCANCAAANRHATGCEATDEDAFCDRFTNATESPPPTVSCDGTLTQLCGAEQQSSFFDCVKCSGEHTKQVVDIANCSNAHISDFCKSGSCFPQLLAACGDTLGQQQGHGSCSSACASCVAATNAKHHNRCPADELRQFCESGCPSGNWIFTDTAAYCNNCAANGSNCSFTISGASSGLDVNGLYVQTRGAGNQ